MKKLITLMSALAVFPVFAADPQPATAPAAPASAQPATPAPAPSTATVARAQFTNAVQPLLINRCGGGGFSALTRTVEDALKAPLPPVNVSL